jgi:hypothetical protein
MITTPSTMPGVAGAVAQIESVDEAPGVKSNLVVDALNVEFGDTIFVTLNV